MTETIDITYLCGICGQQYNQLPLSGMNDSASMAFPVRVCPDCGPHRSEAMEICRELTIGSLLN